MTLSIVEGLSSPPLFESRSKPRTTGLRLWLWRTVLTGSPEHSPHEMELEQPLRSRQSR